MVRHMPDVMAFRKRNREGWGRNSDYWLNSRLRHVEDTRWLLEAKLPGLMEVGNVIIDMGCGDGYPIEYLTATGKPFQYLGLDFNPRFIDHLRAKHAGDPRCSFALVDLEEPIAALYRNRADLVLNSFNFFEFADLSKAFENAFQMLKVGGRLVILTIDPTYLMLALSDTMSDLKEVMAVYERTKAEGEVPRFFQNIDLGDGVSENLTYASVLYSLRDYYRLAKNKGMQLVDYDEIICTSKYVPKIYWYIEFKKLTD